MLALLLLLTLLPQDTTLVVGSKKFTEGVLLGEVATLLLRDAGFDAAHRDQIGGTRVLWEALRRGDIDVYPDYTGTIRQELLAGEDLPDERALRDALARYGVRMTRPLGFNNTYAIGMDRAEAERLGIETVSDLADHPDLRLGFTNEFMDRPDGWPGLQRAYGLPHRDVRGLDHDLAYRGLADGTLAATDLYSTDAEIRYHDLRVLADDRDFFPRYDAVYLYRADLPDAAVTALERLAGRISEAEMVAMNARAKVERVPEAAVAADFLRDELGVAATVTVAGFWERLGARTAEHLGLVGLSLLAAILLAIPLGVLAAKVPGLEQGVLGVVGVIYTIPSLALLVFMIPVLGIGAVPAMVALFLYSLLPIVRNTHAGLKGIAPELRESAEALGLPPAARLRRVELPLALPAVLAGIKTAAVINIGTATLGALIGAGGYGQPILTGIRLDDTGLILEGAVPAALLALAAQGLFEVVERLVVPEGLRLKPEA
ncbi:MAG: glycine betaine ABC transporter substrate-binding protein [Rhodothermales bacterium]|nr:glycine betaine ABC transporter substrate-binding protein [Rhodothermales bacterium]